MRAIIILAAVALLSHPLAARESDYRDRFDVRKSDLTHTGRNPYFILEPGHRLVLERGKARLAITVLDRTRKVDGVEARIVEERETAAGKLKEVSRNYFAIHKITRDVYYFGEEVDIFKGDGVRRHEGAWLSGMKGARFGLMMRAKPNLRSRYYQEIAPEVALDRAEIVSLSATVKTPAGTFRNCIKTAESTPLEPGVIEYKYYAPGIGLVQDGDLKLSGRTHR